MSLEVGEHLPRQSAVTFVTSLTQLSDYVLFSAATPSQDRRNHVNLKWQGFWAKVFEERGYSAVDAIRGKIWNDPSIRVRYRQNALLFVEKQRTSTLAAVANSSPPLSVVHPEVYLASPI